MTKRILLFLLVTGFTVTGVKADQPDHRLTNAERAAMPDFLRNVSQNSTFGIVTPPTSPVRASAEWEEIDALIVVWTSYTNIVRQIINYAQSETKVLVVCSDSTQVIANLSANQVPINNVDFIQTGYNTIWCRDYGPWNVYTDNVDSLFLIDWIYNRPRAKDDTISRAIATFKGLPLYETTTAPYDLVHTGGNFMCDGMGTGFSSRLVLNENPTKSEQQIDSIMYQFMGINRYIKMNQLPYDGIGHIDMHMKLLDEETLLVGEYLPGVSDGPYIDSNITYVLNNFNSSFGTPYKVIRIPMPPDANNTYPNAGGDYRTYTNAVFVNKTIIVPTYDPQYDTTALRIWQEAMPGYRIRGIDCNQIIPSLGAIHCITKEVSSNNLLRIVHQPLRDQAATLPDYQINATIEHRSGITGATLYYRTDTLLPYTAVNMSLSGASPNSWTAAIPGQPAGTTVYYYIRGTATNGKSMNRPMPAPLGYWKFTVTGTTSLAELPAVITAGTVYPNPSKGLTCIQLSSTSSSKIDVRLLNLMGQTVEDIYSGQIDSGEKRIWFNTSNCAAGIYLVEVRNGNQVVRQKVVVR
ncbi:MAG: hypothetical protein RIQ47_509 [Bacteroidota bacterium]|jgi:agmatine deiminase